jgi:hypothetical protein
MDNPETMATWNTQDIGDEEKKTEQKTKKMSVLLIF